MSDHDQEEDLGKKLKLTRRVIESTEAQSKLYYIRDTDIVGFMLIVRPTGVKTYVFDYRLGKGRGSKKQRITIGTTDKLAPEQAREKAKGFLAQVIRGENPREDERKQSNKHLLSEVWQQFLDEHVAIKNRHSTYLSTLQRGKRILEHFKGQYVEDITPQHMHDFMLSLKEYKTHANRCRSNLSKMFNLCERPWAYRSLNSNPCKGLMKYPEKRRERFLDDAELRRYMGVLNKAISDARSHTIEEMPLRMMFKARAACYYKLMLLTGARGAEWRKAKLLEIDMMRRQLRPESTKNDEPAISFPPACVEILEFLFSLPRPEGNPYLFPGKYKENMGTPRESWKMFKTEAKLEGFNPHDLRHSWAAFALASGLSLADVGQQLNHKSYQTTKRYEHLADKVKQKNVESVSDAIQNISSGEAEIIDIRTARSNPKQRPK
jgi:integrase